MYNNLTKRFAFCALVLLPFAAILVWGTGESSDRSQSQYDEGSIATSSVRTTGPSKSGGRVKPVVIAACDIDQTDDETADLARQPVGSVKLVANFGESDAQTDTQTAPNRIHIDQAKTFYPSTGFGGGYFPQESVELPDANDAEECQFEDLPQSFSSGNDYPATTHSDSPISESHDGQRDALHHRSKSDQTDGADDISHPGSFNPLRPAAKRRISKTVAARSDSTLRNSPRPASVGSFRKSDSADQTADNTEEVGNPLQVELDRIEEPVAQPYEQELHSDATPNVNVQSDADQAPSTDPTAVADTAAGNAQEHQSEQTEQPTTFIASTRTLEAGRSNNAVRDAISPENYGYSENVPPALTIAPPAVSQLEQAWESHSLPQQITGTLWWTDPSRRSYRDGAIPLQIDLDALLIRTLQHSAQIQVFSELPLIRDTAITEASANFDWHAFMEAMWNDNSDPVGNTLTTGGDSRFNDQKATTAAGLRRRNQLGGQTEIAQEFGHQNNNSNFFLPNDQATARLRLSYTHPLLRGAGRYYNQSLIVLAQVDSKVARNELERQIEGHLLEVTRAYWGLSLERGVYLQRVRLYERSKDILDSLIARQGIDTYRSQIVRAQSSVSSREAALIRAEVAVRNAEARVRALVNDPEFGTEREVEIIPIDDPIDYEITANLEEVLLVAMQNRSEIQQAFKQIKAAGVRKDMTKNELLPTMNLVMNSYLSGLRGNSDVSRAWADQFSTGSPSYGIGFQMDRPVGNRAARARHQRRRLELRQFESQLRLTMETVNLEVGIAVRETNASFREMQAKYRAMTAAAEDSDFVKQRWELLPGDNQNASLVFDELLRTQDRLTTAENEFLKAQTTYNLSLTNIKKAAGMLLEAERIGSVEVRDNGTPQIRFQRASLYQEHAGTPATDQQSIDAMQYGSSPVISNETVIDAQPPALPSSNFIGEPASQSYKPAYQPAYEQPSYQPTLDTIPQGPALPADSSSRRYPFPPSQANPTYEGPIYGGQ